MISGYRKRPRPKEDPEAREFALRGLLLRETHDNSNYILVRIPIEIGNSARGEKAIAVAEGLLPYSLLLSGEAITRLREVRLINLPRSIKPKRLQIDYVALQQTYRRMLAEGPFSNQSELARHLGVSRVWVSTVLKGKRNPTGQ